MAGRPRTVPLSVFGRRLRDRLSFSGLDRGQIMRDCGIAPATLRRWEVGEVTPSNGDLHLISWRLGTTAAWLRGEDDAGSPSALDEFDVLRALEAMGAPARARVRAWLEARDAHGGVT